jgi:hypothetical protein
MTDKTVFLTLVRHPQQRRGARMLIDSIRTFGGAMCDCPIWLFEADPQRAPCQDLARDNVQVIPLVVPESVKHNWFGSKVTACAQAEAMVGSAVRSLVWFSPDCLVIQPPLLFDLVDTNGTPPADIAVRPVHIRNVGLPVDAPLDAFWRRVYETVGVPDVQTVVESFVDKQRLRAYFNSHVLSVNPVKGLFRRWLEVFAVLVSDTDFQSGACRDELHHIFLHQAVLSTLIVTSITPERIRMLPPTYGYPYNLQPQIPEARRVRVLNDIVCTAYEDRSLHPDDVEDIGIEEPLRAWLAAQMIAD